jgi:hypothetical protein
MTEETGKPKGFIMFWTTIPGVLTAVTGLLATAASIFAVTSQQTPSPVVPELPVPSTAPAPAAPSPAGPVGINLGALPQYRPEAATVEGRDLITACGAGDLASCLAILDGLASGCEAGDGESCDWLYALSDAGSDYELYGATCGDRFEGAQNAGSCRLIGWSS